MSSWSVGEEWARGSQQRRGSDRVSQPWHLSLLCNSSLPPCIGIPFFFPPFEKNIRFLLEGGQFGCRASGAPLTVSAVSAAACMQGFHISLLLFMNLIFFLHAHSSFQTFGQATPCLVQAWVWLQRCLFFLFCFD